MRRSVSGMEFEFDKEIDSLLRQAARRDSFVSTEFSVHPDADEISAFAENALPAKARLNVMEHLADCTRCRKILATVISFNSETESEVIHANEPKSFVSAPKIPWYSQLFAFPALAYTMGGLVLVFGGILGFVAFESFNQSKNASIAQIDKTFDQQPISKGSPESSTPASSYSNSNTPLSAANTTANTSNSAANTSINPVAAPTATLRNSNTGLSAPVLSKPESLNEIENRNDASPKKTVPVTNKPNDDRAKTDEKQAEKKKDLDNADKVGELPVNGRRVDILKSQAGTINNQQTQTPVGTINNQQTQIDITPGARNARSTIAQNPPKLENDQVREEVKNNPAPANKKSPKATEDLKNKDEQANGAVFGGLAASKTVSSKNFQNVSGIWTDSAYTGGRTKTIKRNSERYKKLDPDLRSIADSFGGTVIVVWKNKNYKIQ